jgi:hypothetical protein
MKNMNMLKNLVSPGVATLMQRLLLLVAVGSISACGGGGGSKITQSDAATKTPVAIAYATSTPAVLYLSGTPGATRSEVAFLVTDASGKGVAGQSVRFQLLNGLLGTAFEGAAADGTMLGTTDSDGIARVFVHSGTVPGAVRIAATLVTYPALVASSLELRVASGRAAQRNVTLAATTPNIEGMWIDGAETTLTISLADRQGNPVPDGVQVNFVTESGVLIPPSCVVQGGSSRCSVTLRSQGTRPADGRVNILAYTPGEEDFVDLNGNNVYDSNEAFTDQGDAFRDDDESRTWQAGEFQVRRGGSLPCTSPGTVLVPGRDMTCDGKWGETDVRRQIRVVFATGEARFSTPASVPRSGSFTVVVSDWFANNLAFGSTVTLKLRAATGSSCQAEVANGTIPLGLDPTPISVTTKDCSPGDGIELTARSPSGVETSAIYVVE